MVEMGDDDPVSLERMTKRMLTLPVDAMIMSMSIKAEDFDTFRPSPGFGTVLLTMYEHPHCTMVDSDPARDTLNAGIDRFALWGVPRTPSTPTSASRAGETRSRCVVSTLPSLCEGLDG